MSTEATQPNTLIHKEDSPSTSSARGEPPEPLGLGALLAPVRTRLWLGGALQALGSLAALVPYVSVVETSRELLAPGPTDDAAVWTWVGVAIAGLLLRTMLSGIAYTVTHFADAECGLAVRRGVAERLGRVPLGWFGTRSSGRVKRLLQDDVHAMHHLVAHAFNDLVGAIVFPLGALGYLFWVDWRLALIALAPVVLFIVAYGWMMRDGQAQMARWSEAVSRLNASVVEFVGGIAVVKTFGQTGKAHASYRRAGDELADFFGKWVGPLLRVEAVSTMIASPPIMLLVCLASGTWFIGEGWIEPVDVLPFLMLGVGLGTPVMTLGFGAQAVRTAGDAAGRIGALLVEPVLERPTRTRQPQGHRVEFDNVTFSYDGENTVLNGVDLVLEPGTVTALVGPSGSGKTTLARMLPRFWDPDSGAVRIGGVDLREIDDHELYRTVGFVFQDTQLLRASLRDNIALGRPDATDAEVREVARLARVDEIVERLPAGWQTRVGERGAALSGGERQRVSIARALLKNAPVVLLDEATAALDPENEAAVHDALRVLAADRTLIVIAHRLQTVMSADNIVVLDEGRVVQQGTHEQLVARPGRYADFWHERERAKGWRLTAPASTENPSTP